MTEKERLIRIVDYLRSQGHGSSQAEIGFCLGFSNRSSFNQVVTGKAKISNNFLERLKKLDPNINIDWLRSGNGEMLLSNNINNTPDVNKDTINQKNITEMNEELKKLSKQIEFLTDVVNRGLSEHSEFMKKYEMSDYVKFSDLGELLKKESTGT